MRAGSRGFTYVWLLIAVALLSVGLAAGSEAWVKTVERQREDELAWVGTQYVLAIGSYYQAAPMGPRRYPPTLDDLLQDDRSVVLRRHLRRLYVDPFTGKADWEIQLAPDGGVIGVASRKRPRQVFRYVPA